MYVGRIVCVGRNQAGALCVSYRVSSRSFPNRQAVLTDGGAAIVPKPGHEGDVQKNPYIAYNCLRIVLKGAVAVISNGSHTDPIAEKIDAGTPPRDALALSLMALDYEKDAYDTPRLAAVADTRGDSSGWLGVVRKDGVEVRRMPMKETWCFFVATYERNSISMDLTDSFTAATAQEACEAILGRGVFGNFTNPVSAVAAMQQGKGFEAAILDAPGETSP